MDQKNESLTAILTLISFFLGIYIGYLTSSPWWMCLMLGLFFVCILAAITENYNERDSKKDKEKFSKHSERKIHLKAPESESQIVQVDWYNQIAEIERARKAGEYDFARKWLQKLAYTITATDVPEEIHAKFKILTASFAKEDPLYIAVMEGVKPEIELNPGIIQSQLSKKFPQFQPEEFRYALYYADFMGEIIRMKKGRSYELKLP